jgi:hypothetical protein
MSADVFDTLRLCNIQPEKTFVYIQTLLKEVKVD